MTVKTVHKRSSEVALADIRYAYVLEDCCIVFAVNQKVTISTEE
jgi:hypothetical protein